MLWLVWPSLAVTSAVTVLSPSCRAWLSRSRSCFPRRFPVSDGGAGAALAVDGKAASEKPSTAAVNAAPIPRRRDSRWVIPKSLFVVTGPLIESTGAHGVLLSGCELARAQTV